jgi:hypothetical protein
VAAAEWEHLRRTSTRGGRRFTRVAWDGWRGWARRDAAPFEALAFANAGLGPADRRTSPPRAQASGELLSWRAPDPGPARARTDWALAQLLFTRGRLAPEPLALLRRDGEARLWWRPEPGARTLAEIAERADPSFAEHAAARRAACVLVKRLLALGRLSPDRLQPGSLLLVPRAGQRFTAQLLDPAAFRPGAGAPGSGRRGGALVREVRLRLFGRAP